MGFAGQHLAVAGRLGISRGYARGDLRGTAASIVVGLCKRVRLSRGGAFAALVLGQTPAYFLLQRGCVVGLNWGCAQSSKVPSHAALRYAGKPLLHALTRCFGP